MYVTSTYLPPYLPTYLPTLKLYSERRPFLIYIYICCVVKERGHGKKKKEHYIHIFYSLSPSSSSPFFVFSHQQTSFVTEKYIDTAMKCMFIK